ncbi:MAG: ATPase domain-containing protein, partial [Chloroflexota bacterium]
MGTTPHAHSQPDSLPPATPEERLQVVLRELERRFGPWIVYRLKDARPTLHPRAIPSGALSLDLVLGIGGYPRGRVSDIVGPASSGKSILSFHLLANAQRQGGFVALVDAAHQASFEQMRRCGVDLADLFLVVPETTHETFEIATLLIESGGLDALVIDGVADLVGESIAAGRLAADGLTRLSAVMHRTPTAVVVLTRPRLRPAAIPLSRTLRHGASIRLAITPLRPLLHPSGDIVGLRVAVVAIKNKLAPAGRRTELDLRRDRGIHAAADLFDLGRARGVLDETSLGLCFDGRV